MTVITMSRNELTRLRVLIDVADGRLSVADATGLIGVGRRQVYRLLDAFQARGPDGLISRKRGRPVFGSLDQEMTPVAGHFNCGHSPPRAKTSRLPTWLAAVTMPSASIRSIIRAARL
jgi:Helix-turn-helix domain